MPNHSIPAQLTNLLQRQNPQFADFFSFLAEHGDADLETWMNMAGENNPQLLAAEITRCLNFWATQVEQMFANPKSQTAALQTMLNFVNAVGEFSPAFRNLLGDLYQNKFYQIKNNQDKQQQLKHALQQALQTQTLNQIQFEIIQFARIALANAQRAYLNGIKQSLNKDKDVSTSAHTAAQDELHANAKVAIESADNQAAFEKLHKLGWMWATLAQHTMVAEFEAQRYPHNKFVHQRAADPAQRNRYLDMQHQKYKGTPSDVLMPGPAGAPAQPVTSAPRPAGV